MSLGRRLFVTGTDTEVGKTWVAAGLLHAANSRGLTTAAVKPVAAGCADDGTNEDALELMAAMSMNLPYQQVNPVALTEAIAPHVAAHHENRSLRADELAGYCREVMAMDADLTLVEGAGGWRVPLNSQETLADLAIALELDVILVVGMRLGCINHALLTEEAIRRDGLRLAGWVANQIQPDMPCFEENLETLTAQIAAPRLGLVPFLSTDGPMQVAPHLDLDALVGQPLTDQI